MTPTRRTLTLALLAAPLALAAPARAANPQLHVYKSPTCGCCNDWIAHLRASGFAVAATDIPESRHARAKLGMPARYGSCHTALVEGYVIEGHVPAREIKRLLRERPKALGLAVPGMPVGSPGMDGPEYRGQLDPYDVLLIGRDGSARVYASYEGNSR